MALKGKICCVVWNLCFLVLSFLCCTNKCSYSTMIHVLLLGEDINQQGKIVSQDLL